MRHRITGPVPPGQDELDARLAATGFTLDYLSVVYIRLPSGGVAPVAGACDREHKRMAVSLNRAVSKGLFRCCTDEELRAALHHEIEHAEGKDRATDYPQFGLVCGGDNPEATILAMKRGSYAA